MSACEPGRIPWLQSLRWVQWLPFSATWPRLWACQFTWAFPSSYQTRPSSHSALLWVCLEECPLPAQSLWLTTRPLFIFVFYISATPRFARPSLCCRGRSTASSFSLSTRFQVKPLSFGASNSATDRGLSLFECELGRAATLRIAVDSRFYWQI